MNKILIGVIGDDIHETGNKIIAQLLEHAGFEVINLGIRVAPSAFVESAKKEKVSAIIVSSLYGQAKKDCSLLMKLFQQEGILQSPIYLGGYLSLEEENWESTEKYFLDLGFYRVYKPGSPIEKTISDLRKDLMLV